MRVCARNVGWPHLVSAVIVVVGLLGCSYPVETAQGGISLISRPAITSTKLTMHGMYCQGHVRPAREADRAWHGMACHGKCRAGASKARQGQGLGMAWQNANPYLTK